MQELEVFKIDEELMYEELMYEMANVRRDRRDDFLLMAINPDPNRIGDPYFKVYDADSWRKATKVARLSFFEPKLIIHTGGNVRPWKKLTKRDIEDIEDYLDSPARGDIGVTVWDKLKYEWNDEYGFYMKSISSYLNGEYDEEYENEPSYVPSYIDPPDYKQLLS